MTRAPQHPRPDPGLRGRVLALRKRAGSALLTSFFNGASALGRLHPKARPARHGLEVLRDIAYRATGSPDHTLDVYRPKDAKGPLPAVLYIHGGGFRILSKDTHWVMALAFARAGYIVFNINYRLAPRHRFPAAAEDACAALAWVAAHGARHGADLSRLVIAGESAGANLATVLAIATSYERPEPWARAAWESGVRPRAVVAACGMLQVSDTERVRRRWPHLHPMVHDRLIEVSAAYMPERADRSELVDPLIVLERAAAPDRPLPPFFAPVGTRDPLLDDTRRLQAALTRLATPCEVQFYPGEVHAFHAFVMRESARRCWRDTFTFLDAHVPR